MWTGGSPRETGLAAAFEGYEQRGASLQMTEILACATPMYEVGKLVVTSRSLL